MVFVDLIVDPRVEFLNVQKITDINGKSFFDIVSKSPGDYTIKVSVSNAVLPAEALVSFQK